MIFTQKSNGRTASIWYEDKKGPKQIGSSAISLR